MKIARCFFLPLLASVALCADEPKPAGKILFHSDFASSKADALPDGFMVLDGNFAVKEIDGKKMLELSSATPDEFGVLFGPAVGENVAARARIRAEGTRRLSPRLSIGLGGASGYRLLVVPAKKSLDLTKDSQVVASAPFEWESGAWTWLQLQARKIADGKWKIEGKAWSNEKPEPKDFAIHFDAAQAPTTGKASVWGAPFSGRPIEFDDLSVTSLAE